MSQEGHRPSTKRPASRHPVNKVMYDEAPMGARIADAVTSFMGSWRFIILQTVIVVVWISGNIYLLFHYDPYPFILLAGNRSAQRDRLTLEHAAKEADVEEKQNVDLLRGNREILEHVQALEERILNLEQRIISGLTPPSS